MSTNRSAASASRRLGIGAGRLMRAWRALPPERRLAAYAAIGLFLTLFLPWYQRHFFIVVSGKLQPAADSETGWAAFSFVEAAVLLVAVAVLTLLFQRAEGKAFHVPGGDGGVITAAGFWTCVLVIWRIFDKQGASTQGQNAISSGIEWGIFVALAVAAFLTYAGSRVRAAHRPEPPLPGEEAAPAGDAPPPSRYGRERERRARPPRPVPAQRSPRKADSSGEEAPTRTSREDPPTRRLRRRAEPLGSVPDWTPGPDETLDLRPRRSTRERPEPAREASTTPEVSEDATREVRRDRPGVRNVHSKQPPVRDAHGDLAPETDPDRTRELTRRRRLEDASARPTDRPAADPAPTDSAPTDPAPTDPAPTVPAPRTPRPPAPSTAAARRERRDDQPPRSDEQLTIPLQEDRPGE